MKKNAISIIAGFSAFVIIALLLALVSCSHSKKPDLTVEIIEPTTGAKLVASESTQVNARISGSESWSRIELWSNNRMEQSYTAAQIQSDHVNFSWTPFDLGPTLLELRLYNRSGTDFVSAQAAVTIIEQEGVLAPSPTPENQKPTETIEPTKENCTVAATVLGDLSIPDGTELKAGQTFTKSWRVHNNGTCDWVNYKLVYINGSRMGGNSPSELRTVKAGEVIDISMELNAPSFPGEYSAIWKIQSDKGTLLDAPLKYRIIIPAPTATPSPTATKVPTRTPVNTSTPKPSQTPTITPSQTPTVIPSPTPEPTATITLFPRPTSTPEPTSDPGPYIEIAMNVQDISQGETLNLSASCNDIGGRVVSGGYTVTDGIQIRASELVDNGWSITAINQSGNAQRISVHATCLVDRQLKMNVRSENGIAPANEVKDFVVNSPISVASLGYHLDETNQLNLIQTLTESDSAFISVHNTSSQDLPFTLQAISISQATYPNRFVYDKSTSVSVGETKQIELTCGQGLALGATFDNIGQLFIRINRPTLNGWLFEVTNDSGLDANFDTELICFDSGFQTIQPITDRELQ